MFKQMHSIDNLKKYPICVSFSKELGAVSIVQPLNNAKSGLLNMEIWKDIEGYEGYYQVSNLGRVQSLDRYISCKNYSKRWCEGKILKSYKFHNDYLYLDFSKKNEHKRYLIHRLVGVAFIPNPENKSCINHKDGNKQNNHYSNLEWCTYSENTKHSIEVLGNLQKGGAILTQEQVDEIRRLGVHAKQRLNEML